MPELRHLSCSMQRLLFPALEEELGPLTGPQRDFLRTIELARLERFMLPCLWMGIGCKPGLRLPLAKARYELASIGATGIETIPL